jgi:TRAP-type C4-dicarboxylate transport system permease small subunit
MVAGSKLRRKPTRTAIVVGSLCFCLSLAVIGGVFVLILVWLQQASPTLGLVLFWVGPLPLVIVVGWLTLFLMNAYERTTGTSLRTKSARE